MLEPSRHLNAQLDRPRMPDIGSYDLFASHGTTADDDSQCGLSEAELSRYDRKMKSNENRRFRKLKIIASYFQTGRPADGK